MRLNRFLARQARRAVTFGFALRLGILLSGVCALWLAVPELDYWAVYPAIIVPPPLLAAMLPDKLFPVATQLLAVLLLLINGYLVDEISPFLAIAIGLCCYVLHACATLAAVWRVDTTADPRIWRSWLARVSAVALLSGVLAAVIAAVTGRPMTGPPALLAAVAAVLVLALISAVAWLYHRRDA